MHAVPRNRIAAQRDSTPRKRDAARRDRSDRRESELLTRWRTLFARQARRVA